MKKSEEDYNLAVLSFDGDTEAWNELYDQSSKIVTGFVKKYLQLFYLGNISYEDIISEAYSRAYEKLGTFKGHSRFSTWICGIAKRIVWQESKKHERRKQTYRNCAFLHETSYSRDPCDIILEAELYKSLWDAFDKLQPLEAYILENRVIHEQTFYELSKTTYLPACVVKEFFQCILSKYSKNFHAIHHDKRT